MPMRMLPFHRPSRVAWLVELAVRLGVGLMLVVLTVRALRWAMRSVKL